jgi:hypothetical protein
MTSGILAKLLRSRYRFVKVLLVSFAKGILLQITGSNQREPLNSRNLSIISQKLPKSRLVFSKFWVFFNFFEKWVVFAAGGRLLAL